VRIPHLDLALLPVNGLQIRPAFNRKDVMDSREAADLLARLRPSAAVPIHYAFTGGPVMDRILLRYSGTVEEFTRLAADRCARHRRARPRAGTAAAVGRGVRCRFTRAVAPCRNLGGSGT